MIQLGHHLPNVLVESVVFIVDCCGVVWTPRCSCALAGRAFEANLLHKCVLELKNTSNTLSHSLINAARDAMSLICTSHREQLLRHWQAQRPASDFSFRSTHPKALTTRCSSCTQGRHPCSNPRSVKITRVMGSLNHNIPESFSAFCNIVSFTAAKTSRMFVVSVACVRLEHR